MAPSDVSPLQTLRAYEAIFNNFRFYTEMSCFLVPAEGPEEWICLQSDLKHFHIKDFENSFGLNEARRHYNESNFQKLRRTKRPTNPSFSGFHDCFVPVLKGGKCVAFLAAGVFLKNIPTRKDLERQWEVWSGRKPLAGDANFKRFVSTVMGMPLLDGPQAKAHLELLKLVASLASGEGDPGSIAAQATRLNHRVFAKWRLNVSWPSRALGLETVGTGRVWKGRVLDAYDRDIARIRRIPRVAMALMLVDPYGRGLDEVDAMIRQRHLERSGFFLAQRLGETVAFSTQDEGLVFLTSPKPGSTPAQARSQMEGTARAIAERMGRMFGTRAQVGIGAPVPEGEGLYPSYRQALEALRWAAHRGEGPVFHEDIPRPAMEPPAKERPWPDAPRLVEACLHDSRPEENAALEEYLRDIHHHSAERPDLTRVHLLDALALYAASLEKKLLLPPGRLSGSLKGAIPPFEKARSIREMIDLFKETLRSFQELALHPSAAGKNSALMGLKTYVAEHFRAPLDASRVARQMGFSRSTLNRYVRQWLGMGFHEYVQEVRMEEAKRLLRSSRQSVAQIARECGFSSSGYFIRAFKKGLGKTPQQYRQNPG